jgi:glycosyltransferase
MNARTDNIAISIITAVYNSAGTVADCIKSVQRQTREVEHIIVDGGSTDGTIDIIRAEGDHVARFVSGPDKGIYDALNKGIGMATGDVIGFLHADDQYFTNNALGKVAERMSSPGLDSCYGDLVYVDKLRTDRIIRYWKSGPYREGSFEKGWMPPHPAFFVRKEIYEKYGLFNTSFRIAADYELMLRFLVKRKITTAYLPHVLLKMRVGGTSNRSLKNLALKTSEDYRAWKVNGLKRKWYTIPLKNISKIPQFFKSASP